MKKLPRVKMRTVMLVQVSKLYTPLIFEAFQLQYERSVAACARPLDGENEYLVTIGNEDLIFEKEYKVIVNSLEQIVICTCNQFKRIGILCGHALKVLNLMNIKTLPPQYILKRWTRESHYGDVQDTLGRIVIENLKLDAMHRKKYLSHKFLSFIEQVVSSPECCLLVDSKRGILIKKVMDQFNASESTSGALVQPLWMFSRQMMTN
jgi:hypothetical protein